ncbi:MAG: hypothetical protein ACI8QS_000993, partial [Planctomycetota bacterium]
MTQKLEQTIETLIEEGTRKGFLTYGEINSILEDQFVPPEQMDQLFKTLESQSVEVVDDGDDEGSGVRAAVLPDAVAG